MIVAEVWSFGASQKVTQLQAWPLVVLRRLVVYLGWVEHPSCALSERRSIQVSYRYEDIAYCLLRINLVRDIYAVGSTQ